MKIRDALKEASGSIPLKEARILLSYLLKKDQLYLIKNSDLTIDTREFFELVARVKEGVPIEYLTKRVSFYSREFFIDFGALIPRPETEILVDKAIAISKEFDSPRIAEIGVGSGVVSIMLATLLDRVSITATDISDEALKIAEKNIEKFALSDRIELVKTDLLEGIEEKFDIIVSNPPYISDKVTLEKKLYYEPREALFGGVEGDEILKRVIETALNKKAGYLCCEMGYDQREEMERFFESLGITDVEFYRDLSGFDRGFTAKMGSLD
jgi:release factor glutamine methyltransferase